MRSTIIRWINALLRPAGAELRPVGQPTPATQLLKALQHFEIDTVLDVGANAGQFAGKIRQAGFEGRLISFEPLATAHQALEIAARRDPHWIVHPRGALGDHDGETTINVAGNSLSSSILEMSPAHSDAAQDSAYIGTESVAIQKLDSIAGQYLSVQNRAFLKVDTQGFESQVLDGAQATLPGIQGVLLETSMIELYQGQQLWREMIERMQGLGFTVWSIERGFSDPRTGRTLQCDLTFFR
jgi:FkbM family methyltransferase